MTYLEPASIGDDDSLSRDEKIRATALMVAAEVVSQGSSSGTVTRYAENFERYIRTGSR